MYIATYLANGTVHMYMHTYILVCLLVSEAMVLYKLSGWYSGHIPWST